MSPAPPTDATDVPSASPPRSPAPPAQDDTDVAAPTKPTTSEPEERPLGKDARERNTPSEDGEAGGDSDDAPSEEGEAAPPLPDEVPPPLPDEAPPGADDDGWEPVWDATAQAYYFYNRHTGVSQWENPRVPDASSAPPPPAAAAPAIATAPGVDPDVADEPLGAPPAIGGYNPAIHGDYDPTAPYAQQYEQPVATAGAPGTDPAAGYAAVGAFNRFTGRWQAESQNPEYHNDAHKSHRQMNAYFDVDAAANSHDGRSLRAERSAKKLTKKELKMFKEKRREKKEEKRRAWLRD